MQDGLLDMLERQTRSDARRLRFPEKLELEFRSDHRDEVVVQRLLLLLIGAVLVAAMPILDAWLLHPPEAYIPEARRVQFGFILPALLLAFGFTADRRLRRWSDAMGLLALFVVVCGWSYQRHLGAQFGYEVPTLLIGVILAGAFALAGLFFWSVAPVAALGLVVFATLEVWTRGPSEASLFNILAMLTLAIVTALAGYLQEHRARTHWFQRQQLRVLSLHDGLTGMHNFRAFQDSYDHLYAAAAREHSPLLVAELDIDYFKQYNDRYGHQQGDECLRRVAEVLLRFTRRSSDLAARTGGEEFTLVTNVASDVDARAWLEALLREVRALNLPHAGHPENAEAVVTLSIGAIWGVPEPGSSPHALLRLADEQLYRAKREGRNRYTFVAMPVPDAASEHSKTRLRIVRNSGKT